MQRFVHDFLKWFPVAMGGGAIAVAGVWSQAKDWIATEVIWAWAQMSDPWIAFFVVMSGAAYVGAIIWTGQEGKAKALDSPQAIIGDHHNTTVLGNLILNIRRFFSDPIGVNKQIGVQASSSVSLDMNVRRGAQQDLMPPQEVGQSPSPSTTLYEKLARRIREHPSTDQFDYPTLKCILRSEIPHPTGQRSAYAGKPPHETEILMTVSSIHTGTIFGCSVILLSIASDGIAETVMRPFTWGSNTTFDTYLHMSHSFRLLRRNLSDPINPDPFVIQIEGMLRPLRENTEYLLVLELRAPPYPYPTIVELSVHTGFGLDVECRIIGQHLPEIKDEG
jgi:hypothetical protein